MTPTECPKSLQTFPPDIPPDQQHLLDAIAAESVTH